MYECHVKNISRNVIWIEGIIMKDAYREILEERSRISKKWNDYFDEGHEYSDEVVHKIKEDDEKLKKMCEEYANEYLRSMKE